MTEPAPDQLHQVSAEHILLRGGLKRDEQQHEQHHRPEPGVGEVRDDRIAAQGRPTQHRNEVDGEHGERQQQALSEPPHPQPSGDRRQQPHTATLHHARGQQQCGDHQDQRQHQCDEQPRPVEVEELRGGEERLRFDTPPGDEHRHDGQRHDHDHEDRDVEGDADESGQQHAPPAIPRTQMRQPMIGDLIDIRRVRQGDGASGGFRASGGDGDVLVPAHASILPRAPVRRIHPRDDLAPTDCAHSIGGCVRTLPEGATPRRSAQ